MAPCDYDHVQKYGEMTRDIGKALQSSSSCSQKRSSSWHGRCTSQSTMGGLAQPGGFRRHYLQSGKPPRDAADLLHGTSFMQTLKKELDKLGDVPAFDHRRDWVMSYSAPSPSESRAGSKRERLPSRDSSDCHTASTAVAELQHGAQESVDAGANERDGWMALAALCLCSSFNAFMCMNFSAAEAATVKALNITEEGAAQLYSYYLITCMLGMTPSMWLSDRHERLSLSTGLWATVSAAWIRWWGIRTGSFGLCLLSQILVGYGACPVSTLPGKISHQRFGPGLRALTTSLMVQANYFGWLLGSSVAPLAVVEGSPESLTAFAFMQCIYSVLVIVAFLFLYRPPPPAALMEDAAATSHVRGFMLIFQAICSKPQFTFQVLIHGFLGGIGFAIPSAIFFILSDLGCPSFIPALANAAFIGTGVSAGVGFGYFCADPKSYAQILKLCYALCAGSLLSCWALVSSGFLQGVGLYIALVLLAAIAGFASLGFTGIAFEDMATFPDIPASYVIWIGYIFILGIAEPLNDVSSNSQGFKTLGCVALVACIVFLAAYKQGGGPIRDISSASFSDDLPSSRSSSSTSSLREPLLPAEAIP